MPQAGNLAVVARAYLERAFAVLEGEHVLPVPRHRRHLHVGTDYFGFLDQEAHDSLEAAIVGTHPRFSAETDLGKRDFANPYISSFLEAAIAVLARTGEPVWPQGPPTEAVIGELIEELRSRTTTPDADMVCIRLVTHLDTRDKQTLELGPITVHPIDDDAPGRRRAAAGIFEQAIFGAGELVATRAPVPHAPPTAVVSTRGVGPKPFEMGDRLSGTVERALLAIRLLHAATCESAYEVRGEPGRIRYADPWLTTFRGNPPGLLSPTTMIRRVATLEPADATRMQGMLELLDSMQVGQDNMIFTSMGMALHQFTLSFHAHTWWEQIVDLATALEAALSGKATTDVILRLKTRAAALLTTQNDPAAAIFRDIDELYGLRSTLVHGGSMSARVLEKRLRKLTTVPKGAMVGTATALAVDRLRDLVRRALLARIALANGNEPLWPLDVDGNVDAALADEATRSHWRSAWRDVYIAIGAPLAAEQPAAAADAISPYRPIRPEEAVHDEGTAGVGS